MAFSCWMEEDTGSIRRCSRKGTTEKRVNVYDKDEKVRKQPRKTLLVSTLVSKNPGYEAPADFGAILLVAG